MSENLSSKSIQEISLDLINLDESTQCRKETREQTVKDYSEAMVEGALFPPVELYHDGSRYWVADGFHRIHATKNANKTKIAANVRVGGKREALKAALKANSGLRRTNADKRISIEKAHQDEEWKNLETRLMAELIGVSHTYVAQYRKEIEEAKGSDKNKSCKDLQEKPQKDPGTKEESENETGKSIEGSEDNAAESVAKPLKNVEKSTPSSENQFNTGPAIQFQEPAEETSNSIGPEESEADEYDNAVRAILTVRATIRKFHRDSFDTIPPKLRSELRDLQEGLHDLIPSL